MTGTLIGVLASCVATQADYEQVRLALMDRDQDGHFAEQYAGEDGAWPADDCDDDNAAVHPNVPEEPYNGIDDDCEPMTPDDDLDGDTFDGDIDCDDENPWVNPAADEIWYDGVDQDCDPDNDDDADGDGVDAEQQGGLDCDDTDPNVAPGLGETCDLVDNDCDDHIDEGVDTWWADLDGDGYGDDLTGPTQSCDHDVTDVTRGGDCDDTSADANPDQVEICNDGLDNDCDGDPTECRWPEESSLSDLAVSRFLGASAGDGFGQTLDASVDLDLDGTADLVVGAPYEGAGDEGSVFAYHAPTAGELTIDEASWRLSGNEPGGELGRTVAVGSEWNDPAPVLIVASIASAEALVFEGPFTGEAALSDAVGSLGLAGDSHTIDRVASGGDLNGDDLADFVGWRPESTVYATDQAGVVLVYAGPVVGTFKNDAPEAVRTGEEAGDRAGENTVGGHDLDGDGLDDLVLGASSSSRGGPSSGAIYVIEGPIGGVDDLASADAVLEGAQAGDAAGFAVSVLGDLDDDGHLDLAIGAPLRGDGQYLGVVHVVLGPFSGQSSLAGADGHFSSDRELGLGVSLTGPGDLDADGHVDVALAAPLASSTDGGLALVGGVGVFYGPLSLGSMDFGEADVWLQGDGEGATAGASLTGGDLDGDGFGDLLVTSHVGLGTGSTTPGVVSLLLGTGD